MTAQPLPESAPGRPGDPLRGAHVVLGVSGSISCYKAVEVASRLVQAGAIVDVALTSHAAQFVTPLTFRSITAREPYLDMWRPDGEAGEAHVELARRADVMLIAPATASTLARIAHGLADDFVSLTALATAAPLLVAPAMDAQMWEHAATQANVATLRERGVQFLGPLSGRLASGRTGMGRLVEPEQIVDAVRARLGTQRGDLSGRRVVVTAGGNREAIDPVRYIGNRSSGKMGYAIAEAARDRGAETVLISTVSLPVPVGVRVVAVESHAQMMEAVLRECGQADALVMAGAVADYRPASAADHKIKREAAGDIVIPLVENADIIASTPTTSTRGTMVKIAFAAETDDLIANAVSKLKKKGARMIVANDVSATDAGFGVDDNRVTILNDEGVREDLPLMTKYAVGHAILDRLRPYLQNSLLGA
ncbi:MAG: bifunctional phosphopantothenoylcysteine decarboxylase/phosphopantothenate--cysteine ligase CoaBC [Chloroflexi bacterium]|nr:bifunctional phosphopantothenoylcysteine decarboxylase/phosphopantothenate--cysteine ligase CoaBC [Chloroflexota bacterium]MDA1240254.1 bifunctional phosphopantothenoylcysteine decarboxylase/phosphopantothenate--cysteine ligase CoaBC [Chloroflexota bacterium]